MTDTTPDALRALADEMHRHVRAGRTDFDQALRDYYDAMHRGEATLRALADEKEQVATAAGVHCTWPSCEHTARGQCLPSIRALPVSSKLVQAAEEVAAIARGEAPAARIHMNGHAYIPETAARDARRAALEEVRKATAAIKDRSDVSSDAWTLTLVDAAIRALTDREPAPGDARPRISDDYTHSGGQAVAAADADAAAARRQVQKLREALAQAKAEIVTAAVADERNRYGYRTDMALWATVALRTIDEALGHE
ncbi:hypothetical protein [Microcystis phage Mwe-JY08]